MIRVGIGGWTYDPWNESFYPADLPKKRQLEYASAHVTAIEINGTYYSTQKPATWADWHKRTPDDFMFTIKASRFCTNRKVLADAGESIARFIGQGLIELGPKLGPILWQFMATKQFVPGDFQAFLALLPRSIEGLPLRHAIEPRHESFRDPAFIAMARAADVAIVVADDETHPQIADPSGGFTYARLQRQLESEPTGYAPPDIDRWAEVAKGWVAGAAPSGLDYVGPSENGVPGDVFVFMINGAKLRAPAAAMALLARL